MAKESQNASRVFFWFVIRISGFVIHSGIRVSAFYDPLDATIRPNAHLDFTWLPKQPCKCVML